MRQAFKTLAGIIAVTAWATHARAGSEFYSYYDGKRYQFTITDERLARCPKWDLDQQENPPYPAAKALAQAKQFIAGVPTSEKTFWTLEDLSLVDLGDDWAWRARFSLTYRGPSSGIWPTMDCWILMDGTQIKPKITKHK